MVISCPDEDDSDMVSVNGGNQLEIVDEFCYLGSFLALSRSCDKDLSTRIGKASEAFTCMCNIWKSKRISNRVVKLPVIYVGGKLPVTYR